MTARYEGREVIPTYSIDSTVATVSEKGLVEFQSVGEATITISYNDYTIVRKYTYADIPLILDKRLTEVGVLIYDTNSATLGYFEVPAGITVRWHGSLLFCEYKSDGTFVDFWTREDREIKISNSSTKVMMSVSKANISTAYIYDVTNSTYIYRQIAPIYIKE